MARQTLKRPSRKICVGDLRDRILLQDRDITEPTFGDVDFGEDFSSLQAWAKVETTAGKTFFDGVNVDVAVSHRVTIRYDRRVTAEWFVVLDDDQRLKIIDVEDFENRHEYLVLLCTERGSTTIEATKA